MLRRAALRASRVCQRSLSSKSKKQKKHLQRTQKQKPSEKTVTNTSYQTQVQKPLKQSQPHVKPALSTNTSNSATFNNSSNNVSSTSSSNPINTSFASKSSQAEKFGTVTSQNGQNETTVVRNASAGNSFGAFFNQFIIGVVLALPLAFFGTLYSSEDFRRIAWKFNSRFMTMIQYFVPELTKVDDEVLDSHEQNCVTPHNTELMTNIENSQDKLSNDNNSQLVNDEQRDTKVITETTSIPHVVSVESDAKAHINRANEDSSSPHSTLSSDDTMKSDVNAVTSAWQEKHASEIEALEAKLQAKWSTILQQHDAAIRQSFRDERHERMNRMMHIEEQRVKLERVLQWHTQHQKLGHHIHRLSSAVLQLEQVLLSSCALGEPWKRVKELADTDSVVAAAVDAVPAEIVDSGVPTMKQLQKRFEKVVNASRRGALVPADAGIAGHLLAGTVSALLIEQKSLVKGKDELSRLTRASYFVNREDLPRAIKELTLLNPHGLPAKICNDWLQDARARLRTNMAIQMLKSHAADLAASVKI